MPPNRLRAPARPEGVVELSRLFLTTYQRRLVMLFGGEPGLADGALLDQMLHDARAVAGDHRDGDPLELAAVYAFGLVRKPFLDGNLKLATVAVATTLRLNGRLLTVSDEELAAMMMGVARGEVARPTLIEWLRAHSSLDPTFEAVEPATADHPHP